MKRQSTNFAPKTTLVIEDSSSSNSMVELRTVCIECVIPASYDIMVLKKTQPEQKPKENKRKKLTNLSKKHFKKPKHSCNLSESSSSSGSDSSSSSSSSFSSCSSDNDPDSFETLFEKTKQRGSIINQKIQFTKHGKTKGFETSAVKGTHLIKLEITDSKDLKGVEPQNY